MIEINASRYLANFKELSLIGVSREGGIDRPAFSEAHQQARDWFFKKAIEAGLEIKVDGAGNHSVILKSPEASKTLLLGSHLDSVKNGGIYDGALGIITALEVVQRIKESGIPMKFHLEVIDFTDEESHFLVCLGSRAFIGELTISDLLNPPCGRINLENALERFHLTDHGVLSAKRLSDTLVCYIEMHIEQGPRLSDTNNQIGIVSGIVGIRNYRISFLGNQNHAGTTPMPGRRDAGRGASSFQLAVINILLEKFPDCVGNIGRMDFFPGDTNVIPGRVDVYLEFRSVEISKLEEMERIFLAQAKEEANRYGLELSATPLSNLDPALMDQEIQKTIKTTADSMGLSNINMYSGAGHDAQLLARIIPTGLIFIPSEGGSHNPSEHTKWEDCIHGANLMLRTVLSLAENNNE